MFGRLEYVWGSAFFWWIYAYWHLTESYKKPQCETECEKQGLHPGTEYTSGQNAVGGNEVADVS